MSDPRCICTMGQSLTGDGCRWCQPQEYIDRLGEWLDEERQDNERLLEVLRSIQNDIAEIGDVSDESCDIMDTVISDLA